MYSPRRVYGCYDSDTMALYTGKGDGGTTKVFGCDTRLSKASELPEALGALDELNSFLGFAKERARLDAQELSVPGALEEATLAHVLHDLQEALFLVQAETAGADKRVGKERVLALEAMINAIEMDIPPITNFSIPGGTELSALIDVSRTLARRAERRLVAATDAGILALAPETKAYLNRLSSILFALARLANHRANIPEENPRY